jgi:ribosomal protein S26
MSAINVLSMSAIYVKFNVSDQVKKIKFAQNRTFSSGWNTYPEVSIYVENYIRVVSRLSRHKWNKKPFFHLSRNIKCSNLFHLLFCDFLETSINIRWFSNSHSTNVSCPILNISSALYFCQNPLKHSKTKTRKNDFQRKSSILSKLLVTAVYRGHRVVKCAIHRRIPYGREVGCRRIHTEEVRQNKKPLLLPKEKHKAGNSILVGSNCREGCCQSPDNQRPLRETDCLPYW